MEKLRQTKAFLLTPRPCKCCGQMMSRELLEKKLADKARRVSEALKNSDGPVGRPRSADYEKIRELRRAGHTQRSISNIIGCSIPTVQRALK